MKNPIFLLIVATMAASLGGCGQSASGPDASATASPPSKPNPWSVGGGATPSASASASPAEPPKPAGSAAPKANPWGMTAPDTANKQPPQPVN